MIKTYEKRTALLKALAHPVRLAILDILRDGEQCVCHMEATLGLRQATISQHLMALREAGLVSDRRDGWNMYYRIVRPEIQAVLDQAGEMAGETERLPHAHAAAGCPCPKCHSTQAIPAGQVAPVSEGGV